MRVALFAGIFAVGVSSVVIVGESFSEQTTSSKYETASVVQWRIISNGGTGNCLINGNVEDDLNGSVLGNPEDCAELHDDLPLVTHFVEDRFGNVSLLDSGKKVLFEFSAAEFDGYESVYPAYPLLTIDRGY